MQTWIKDDNGNKCSVEHFSSEAAAKAALDSLIDCRDCTNCSECSGVSFIYDKKNANGNQDADTPFLGAPPVPRIENIHVKIWEAVSQPKALDMGKWHSCGTTHCRGGWVVHLAGEAGYALEKFHNTALAAQLIYLQSGYDINPCRFYDSNADALADMKRLAEAV